MVLNNRIISTGYNGTPEGVINCLDGGCVRCRDKKQFSQSVGYDVCICVHAEQNALISAARFGIATEGSVLYSTMRPCFDCSKLALQAKITAVYYLKDWAHPQTVLMDQYEILQGNFSGGVNLVEMTDPKSQWANNEVPKK